MVNKLEREIKECPYNICHEKDYTNCNKYIKLITESELAYEIK